MTTVTCRARIVIHCRAPLQTFPRVWRRGRNETRWREGVAGGASDASTAEAMRSRSKIVLLLAVDRQTHPIARKDRSRAAAGLAGRCGSDRGRAGTPNHVVDLSRGCDGVFESLQHSAAGRGSRQPAAGRKGSCRPVPPAGGAGHSMDSRGSGVAGPSGETGRFLVS